MATSDNTWRFYAACHGINTDLFFPVAQNKRAAEQAICICRECPVRQECLDYATRLDIREGIWGGIPETQRNYALKREPTGGNSLTREQVAHGTDRGAQWHRRHKETPCDACHQAERERGRAKARQRNERRRLARQLAS